ncbi:phosphotransferase [Thermasporomyces composti]|jgi:Ser/Thr protein kinase RdoA (MazF antagonist)|uniref:Phosphotransferase family enzyme n=1 Tax=Thermasporomyces composti TaxID=696763 RepID=A0A3D9VEM8_THECX|nr:phosphotransferase [Thermasporomyces composti]REF36604.1 phosphotransferase family enzyme [Thermasporomyces composti]
MREELVLGGRRHRVVRVGDTVRRPMPARAAYVHDVLRLLARHGWPGAPRYLGTDDEGREILSYLPGHVAREPAQPPDVWSEESLARVARLVRQLHDLTAGSWLAGDQEVVCHNAVSPENTVYRDEGGRLRPYAFLDWDDAAPGRRVHDVAYLCWRFLRLGTSANPTGPASLLRTIADAYGLTIRDRRALVETILWRQDQCWQTIEARAREGEPTMRRLVEEGHVATIQDAYCWVAAHRTTLEAALF